MRHSIKWILSVGVIAGAATVAQAARGPDLNQYMVKNPDGTVEVDMGAYCYGKIGLCVYENQGLKIVLSSATDNKRTWVLQFDHDSDYNTLSASYSAINGTTLPVDQTEDEEMTNPIMRANVPIRSVEVGFVGLVRDNSAWGAVCEFKNKSLNLNGPQTSANPGHSGANCNYFEEEKIPNSVNIIKSYSIGGSGSDVRNLNLNSDTNQEGAIVLRVVVDAGSSAGSFHDVTISGATSLGMILEQAENNLSAFSQGISKLDKPHLVRFKQALDAALAALRYDGNEAHVPLTDENVVEAVRLVVVMGEVAGEMLNNYSEAPWAQQPIANLNQTVQVLKSQYFGDSLFAGRPSKSIADLADMIEFELRGIMITLGATTNGNVPASLRNVWKHAQILEGVVEGMRGGDAQAYPQVQALASAWNSNQFQLLLKRLLNSGRDLQGVIQPKMRNLLTGIESLNGVTGVYFVVPSGT